MSRRLSSTFTTCAAKWHRGSSPTSTGPVPRHDGAGVALTIAAYRSGPWTGERVALALRDALFEESGQDIADPDVLRKIAIDHGVYEHPPWSEEVRYAKSWRAGQARGVKGSPHFFCGDREAFCPALDQETRSATSRCAAIRSGCCTSWISVSRRDEAPPSVSDHWLRLASERRQSRGGGAESNAGARPVQSPTESRECNDGPDTLDDAERPRPRGEAVGARHAASAGREGEGDRSPPRRSSAYMPIMKVECDDAVDGEGHGVRLRPGVEGDARRR